MKVILIKDCSDGKINDIVNVKDGYAKNYLIKNKFAIPLNKHNEDLVKKVLQDKEQEYNKLLENAMKIKYQLEKLELHFTLKTLNDNVLGSITRKNIIHKLKENNISFTNNNVIENIKINTLGINYCNVKIFKNVNAKIKIITSRGENV